MKSFESAQELDQAAADTSKIQEVIDDIVYTAVFSSNAELKKSAREHIRRISESQGIRSSSIHPLYMAFGRGEITGFTVPAFNVRMMTYDTVQEVLALALEKQVGAFIFEIARSEIGYSDQRPDEYMSVILAAAIKSGWRGPLFIQGDHFQFSKRKYGENPEGEIQVLKDLIKETLDANFQNIDIDASTLVDLSKQDLSEQQETNSKMTALLTKYIREFEKTARDGNDSGQATFMQTERSQARMTNNSPVSIGGEIGHIGGVNSKVEDFEAFMDGYRAEIGDLPGISKVSVQTGTSHGGVPLPDGTVAPVKLDFEVLKSISGVARAKYGIGGAVQHGASTLPNDLFDKFPQNDTLEIHLATGFQNIVYQGMPEGLRSEMHEWTTTNCTAEREEGWNDEQYIYKCRKKAIGPFKQKLWDLSESDKTPIRQALRAQFELLFNKLNVSNTYDTVTKYIH